MPLLYMKRYTRKFIQSHPDWLFVFGDNFERRGLGGQAKEARGEPNAVGVPTKRKPTMSDDAFLTDADFKEWWSVARPDLGRIADALNDGQVVIWPLDGVGTGLGKLASKAPRIWHDLTKIRKDFEAELES